MLGDLPTSAVVATPLISLGLVLVFGKPMIGLLQRAGAGQRVRDDGPQRHLEKEGTPTMGGILIIAAAATGLFVGGYAVWSRLAAVGAAWVPLAMVGVCVTYAGIGLADDWKKVRHGRSLGLRARHKLALQLAGAAAFVCALVWWEGSREVALLGSGDWWRRVSPPAFFWVLAIAATSNAMNLADGLDGLAAGLCVISGLAFAALALVSVLDQELSLLGLSLAGACLGFLWFNRHPARLFMGDVGSLALGAAMAAIAAVIDNPIALIGICLIPFVEMLSVIIQVISFKTTGKRVFKMSPIHHHFELSGWSERKVVYVFWGVQAVAAGAVVAWYLMR